MVVIQTSIEELAQTVAQFPLDAQKQVIDFVALLKAKLRQQESDADAKWDAAIESTTPEQLERIRTRVISQRSQAKPLFNAEGKITPP